jgi:putative oxidoreductase
MTQEPLLRLFALFSLGVITMNFNETGAAWAPRVLSLLRIMTGLVLLQHPLSKLFGFPASNFMPKMGELPWIAGIFEIVGAPLLILGLFTRPVAFILAGLMACAYFIGHAPRGFYPQLNGGSLAIMYSFVCLYIAAAGPGPWSVDAMRGQK